MKLISDQVSLQRHKMRLAKEKLGRLAAEQKIMEADMLKGCPGKDYGGVRDLKAELLSNILEQARVRRSMERTQDKLDILGAK